MWTFSYKDEEHDMWTFGTKAEEDATFERLLRAEDRGELHLFDSCKGSGRQLLRQFRNHKMHRERECFNRMSNAPARSHTKKQLFSNNRPINPWGNFSDVRDNMWPPTDVSAVASLKDPPTDVAAVASLKDPPRDVSSAVASLKVPTIGGFHGHNEAAPSAEEEDNFEEEDIELQYSLIQVAGIEEIKLQQAKMMGQECTCGYCGEPDYYPSPVKSSPTVKNPPPEVITIDVMEIKEDGDEVKELTKAKNLDKNKPVTVRRTSKRLKVDKKKPAAVRRTSKRLQKPRRSSRFKKSN